MREITEKNLNSWKEAYKKDAFSHTLNAAMSKSELSDIAYVPANAVKLEGEFAIDLKTSKVMAQQKSGRCWLFAALNIMREQVNKRLNIKDFELSANYLSFYDKLEKSNNFLEMIIENGDKDINDRMVEHLMRGIGDGGYWDMAVDLVKKYGAVPKSAMAENYQSNHTEKFRKLQNTMLRAYAVELRERLSKGEDVTKRKEEMMAEMYKTLCIVFGQPVDKFDFTYRDENGDYHVEYDMTPKDFYKKYIDIDLDEYITITNEPTARKKLNQLYNFHYLGSVVESTVKYLNLSIEELKDLSIAQLKGGEPVWFACDSGAFGDRALGIWDQDSFDYEGILGGINLSMSKKDRLESRDSFGTHAMILVGVNFDKDGAPDRFKIENSWGGDVGRQGYFVCSNKYFDEYVYEAIINKKYLNEAQRELLNMEPVELLPWEA